jgi:RNA polymerase sigma factor (sigma-70 family)
MDVAKAKPGHRSGVMMAICKRYAYTSFESEDIFQEAFVKIFMKINQYTFKGSFEGWMKQIVVTTAINHFHKNKKFYNHQDPEHEAVQLSESNPDAVSQLSAADLTNLISSLPQGYRLVFNLYVVEGYSHKEIGELLNISEGTSKSQLFKAKEQLKKLLQNYSDLEYVTR